MATAAELAERERKEIQTIFEQWDEDGSNTIERNELAAIMQKVSVSLTDADIDKLLKVIDTNCDGVIDFTEFVAWVTDRKATQTVGKDGWIENFDSRSMLKPLFDVFDKAKTGFISRDEFVECAQILGNSLSLHPLASGDSLAIDWKENPLGEKVGFDEFVDWQTMILQKSGILNNKLPMLVKELAEAMQDIFMIDKMHGQGGAGGGDSAQIHKALEESIKKVAETVRLLYTEKVECITGVEDTAFDKDTIAQSCWFKPPSSSDMHHLARECAKSLGIRLDNVGKSQTQQASQDQPVASRTPSKSATPERIPSRTPSKSASQETSSDPSKSASQDQQTPERSAIVAESPASLEGSSPSADATGVVVRSAKRRPSKVLTRRISLRSTVQASIGQVTFVIPDVNRGKHIDHAPWLAKVMRRSPDATGEGMVVDACIYKLSRPSNKWTLVEGTKDFDKAYEALPKELKLYSLLKVQALMGNQLSWPAVKQALNTAEQLELLAEEEIDKYEEHMQKLAEKHIEEVMDEKELTKSLSETAFEYLERDIKKSPMEVLVVLSDLGLLEVGKQVWADIMAPEQDQLPLSKEN
eukprot:TRINITY_DN72998_c0_g1_i1.p1 TRINITY_DN72998_c0_g1~~TRINITY_DN72998_c0_g1_i1.p1  ORF type:complete len:584 (-),score=160.16 TRINITY_DN72998_c0_g1_i1:33-1784(-)